MSPNKKQTTVTLDADVFQYLIENVKTKRFRNVSHGIDYSINLLRRLDKAGLTLEILKVLEDKEREEREE